MNPRKRQKAVMKFGGGITGVRAAKVVRLKKLVRKRKEIGK